MADVHESDRHGRPAAQPATNGVAIFRSAVGWVRRREPLRRSLQTVVAVALAYVAAAALPVSTPSWVVFSALFVVQDSVGGTVTSAVNRVAGAGVGLVLGLLAILVVGIGEWRSLVALVAAVAVMAAIAARWPRLQYGLVTVAILVVAPAFEVFEGALITAGEIAVGAVCGAFAGAVVLPVAAHRSALRHMGRATAACSRLLAGGMATFADGRDEQLASLHIEIEADLDRARELISQSRYDRRARRNLPSQFELLRHIDRLWYTLALVDRLSGRRLPPAVADQIADPLARATTSCCRVVDELADALQQGKEPGRVPDHCEPARRLIADIDGLRGGDVLRTIPRAQAEGLFTLSFTWQQLDDNVAELARCLAGAADAT